MSRRQLARTVIDGKLLTFAFSDTTRLTGYLCGMDDFHWMVITPDGEQALVHKGSASRVMIAMESTYDSEPRKDEMERIIGPFRATLAEEQIIPAHTVSSVMPKGA